MKGHKHTPDTLWEKVAIGNPDECWPWQGSTTANTSRPDHRYGEVNYQGKKHRVHRLVYAMTIGALKPGQCVLHKCDNPLCCNPSHLEAGTQAENMRQRMERGRAPKGEQHWNWQGRAA